jgi:hypothetical protein
LSASNKLLHIIIGWKICLFIALVFLLKIGIYRYLPVLGIGVLDITGITVFEKVGIFAIPNNWRQWFRGKQWVDIFGRPCITKKLHEFGDTNTNIDTFCHGKGKNTQNEKCLRRKFCSKVFGTKLCFGQASMPL